MEQKLLKALPSRLLPWYAENKRVLPWRENQDPYRVWISEIMLQQTRVEAVVRYYNRFLQAFPNVYALANADDALLMKCWEGLGYYSRARNLKKAAVEIVQNREGVFPSEYNALLQLPGIGAYTAGAVASICFGEKRAAVDGNVLRIVSRITNSFSPIDAPKTKTETANALEAIYPQEAGAFTQSLMELGAMICIPKSPRCGQCPVQDLCAGKKAGNEKILPVKSPKKDKKIEKKTVFILKTDKKIALCKRAEKGLLADLWQLPNCEKHLSVQEALRFVEALGAKPYQIVSRVEKQHIFTHIRWEMVGYTILCREEAENLEWVTAEQRQASFAVPTAFKQFLDDMP